MAKRRFSKIISVLILVGLLWSLVEARLLFLDRQNFADDDIPSAFAGYRLIFLSDIHVGPFFGIRRLERLVERINAESPDLVILGGDYVFLGTRDVPLLAETLGHINATTVAVMGNHDNWEDPELIRREFAGQGIEMLDNEGFWIEIEALKTEGAPTAEGRQRIRIAGVDDWQTAGSFLAGPLDGVGADDFVVLASHNPDAAYLLANEDRVDLMLSGHTHGGQISFFGIFSPLVPISHGQDYVSGWVKEENFSLLVSRGVGTTILPLRFFSLPQWHEITLSPTE